MGGPGLWACVQDGVQGSQARSPPRTLVPFRVRSNPYHPEEPGHTDTKNRRLMLSPPATAFLRKWDNGIALRHHDLTVQ